jgi:hypothetical protein
MPRELVPGALSDGGCRRPVAVQLEDGAFGYCMARTDDCLRPCIATVLQVPVEQVPDPQLDRRLKAGDDPERINRESWEMVAQWLDGCGGLEFAFHENVPIERERWIGICLAQQLSAEAEKALRAVYRRLGIKYEPRNSPFVDHSLVMSHGRILHDPVVGLPKPRGYTSRPWRPSEVAYGISIERKGS